MNNKRYSPCSHPGCYNHITHPCEGCRRIQGRYINNTMDIKKYFQDVSDYIDNLTDEEFYKLLLKSGLEKCPIIEQKQYEDVSNYQYTLNYNPKMWMPIDVKTID